MANLDILANHILHWVQQDPDRQVLTISDVSADGELIDETRTYQQLWDNAQRLAEWMRNQGLQSGDAFAIVMQNHPEFVELMIASSILGTIFVPVDARTKGDKLKYMLDFAECKGAFVADYALDNAATAWADRDDVWISTLDSVAGDYPRMEDALAAALPEPLLDVVPTDDAMPMQMLYTSGTTGDPKAILSPYNRFAEFGRLPDFLGLTDADRPYTGLSLTHMNAQITLGFILLRGLSGVISLKFTKSRLWDITRKYQCTLFNLLGGMTTAIYAEPLKDNDGDNPVRLVISAGMPASIWENFAKRFNLKIFEAYGAAEGGFCFNHPGEGPVGSCGKAVPRLELKVFNEQDEPCAPGEAGEVCFRNIDGSSPVVNYFKNPDASTKKTRGGWLRMGDIGHLDADGWLFFHYRKGGGIRRNGDFINPGFVEKALSELACIDDVFVYGVPASSGAPGEKDVVAAVVLLEDEDFSAETVFADCRKKLEANFVPSFLQVVKEIPKTASEKPQERFLLEAFSPTAENVFSA